MKLLFTFFALLCISIQNVFAIDESDITDTITPEGSLDLGDKNTIDWLLAFIQDILISVVLPVVVVWAFLWVAYELFTADGDESKMKQAWLAVTYSAIAIILILMAYFIISLIWGLNFS